MERRKGLAVKASRHRKYLLVTAHLEGLQDEKQQNMDLQKKGLKALGW